MRKKDVMRPLVWEIILKDLHWKGTKKCYPYVLNGINKKATIKLEDLYKIVKWETSY